MREDGVAQHRVRWRLDEIVDEDVQRLKARLSSRAPKTVNNVLTVLGKLLRVGARWKVIAAMPCSVDLLRVTLPLPKFHDFGAYERLLRHTFCSHLAMRGAPAKAIQKLGGHIHLSTTQRYMHLSPH